MEETSNDDDDGIKSSTNQKFRNTAKFFKTAAKFQILPFTWTSTLSGQNRLASKPEIQLIWWYFICFSIIPYEIFICVDLYYQLRKYIDSSQFMELTIHILYPIGWTIIVCLRLDYFLKRKLKVEAFNKLMEFIEESIKADSKNESLLTRHWEKFDKIMSFGLPAALSAAGCFAVLVLIFPGYRKYWWYLLVPAEKCHILVKILFCGVEFVQFVYPWISFFGNIYLMTFYIACLVNALNVLNITQGDKLRRSTSADTLKLQRTYNSIHILTTMYNQAFGGVFGISAMKITCTLAAISQCCLIILMAGKVNIILTVGLIQGAATVILSMASILRFAGNIHKNSQLIKSKYTSRWRKEFKIMTSCKPLAINVGCLYRIKKITTLSYFNLFLTNFANTLIALKEFRL